MSIFHTLAKVGAESFAFAVGITLSRPRTAGSQMQCVAGAAM